MKQFLLFSLLTIFTFQLQAQLCIPDETYRDSTIGVYPPPLSAENPDAGITENACINAPYEFVFTFVIPDTIEISGNQVTLDSIVVNTDDAVGGLPIGINYACNPGTCVFTPEDTIACLVLYGTAEDTNMPGDYPLTISTTIYSSLGFPFPVTFPTTILPGADGEYILTLEEEGSDNCFVGVEERLGKDIRFSNSPNPFGSLTQIEIYAKEKENLSFTVYDMLGKVVHRQSLTINEGVNYVDFDGTHLDNGIYTYSLSNQKGSVASRMVINR